VQIGMNLSQGDLLGAFYTDSYGNLNTAKAPFSGAFWLFLIW